MSIYQPAEDSYLLSEVLEKYLKDKPTSIQILDMGSGSGIQAKTCRDLGFTNILTADINPEVISHLKSLNFNTVQSHLFSNISKQQSDLIIFNPPYLPEDKREPEDSRLNTTAGKQGYEIIIRFLEQAKDYLSDNGSILLLISSLSKPEVIKQKIKFLDYKIKELGSKKIAFFEELFVFQLNL